MTDRELIAELYELYRGISSAVHKRDRRKLEELLTSSAWDEARRVWMEQERIVQP